MYLTGTYELRTHDDRLVAQPTTTQLAEAILTLASPDNTYLCVQPQPDTGWYVEVTLPNPATADPFNGPYEIHFQDDQANPAKWITYGDDPQVIATRVIAWVTSMVNSRR